MELSFLLEVLLVGLQLLSPGESTRFSRGLDELRRRSTTGFRESSTNAFQLSSMLGSLGKSSTKFPRSLLNGFPRSSSNELQESSTPELRPADSDGAFSPDVLTDEQEFTDNTIDAVPTSISPTEQLLLFFTNPFHVFNRPDKDFEDNANRLLFGLPDRLRAILSGGSRSRKQEKGSPDDNTIPVVFPGTLWCGSGDLARGTNDTGLFRVTDSCCRAHDSCPEFIEAGENSRGLRNNGFFTRSHCVCDEEFHRCLTEAHSLVSKKIGITYFNVLRPQCFKLEYPIVRCAHYTRFLTKTRCLAYEVDVDKNKTWQWFDNKYFP